MLLCVGRTEGLEKRGESSGEGDKHTELLFQPVNDRIYPINLCRLGPGREGA